MTLPSHANILSGRLSIHEHGVRENSGFRFPRGGGDAGDGVGRGFATGAFVSAFPLDVRFGLERGFDVYDDRRDGKGAERRAFREPERAGTATVAAAVDWVGRQATPWFARVHLYDPHFPYVPPEPLATQYRGTPYHADVHQ